MRQSHNPVIRHFSADITLGLSIMSLSVVRHGSLSCTVSVAVLAFISPCRQRRLSVPVRSAVEVAALPATLVGDIYA
jgi:hypothetical protein